ncbi:MAG TPA: GTPase Era [Erysipelotrichaceae bacterium]|nr:GTPase Era [Erysipelotrichaceae bacterium]
MKKFKSGFVALVGRPNAGKSTLVNNLVNDKVAIVTDKPQTTRNVIRGVRSDKDSQIIFMDTPGIHKPRHKLGGSMVTKAYSSLTDADLIYYVVDGTQKFGPGDRFVLEKLTHTEKPVFLILNKIDRFSSDELIQLLVDWQERFEFKEMIPISALKDLNVEKLIEVTKDYLTDDIKYYPEDQKSDQDEDFLYAEIIREKLIFATKEEIPHSIAVVIESKKIKDDMTILDAVIIVERESQKGIVIGKGGSVLKKVGSLARRDIQNKLNKKVFLNLFVTVEKNWRNNPKKVEKYLHKDE